MRDSLSHVLDRVLIAVMNVTSKSSLGRKRLIWADGHSPSLRNAKAGTQADRSLETGTEAETTTEEQCLLICSRWLTQLAFFLLHNCPGVGVGVRVACTVCPSLSVPPHTGIG